MESTRRKNASLAINAILRGLEFDQLVFHYDETARPDVTSLAGRRAMAARDGLPPLTRTTNAA